MFWLLPKSAALGIVQISLPSALICTICPSQIPDIVIGTSDDNEVEVCLDCRDHTIFSALHFPYGRSVKIHDLRSVVEYYLRDRNTSIEDFQLRAISNGRSVTLATFQVLYLEQHFTGDIGRTNRGSSESRGELARAMPSRGRGRRSQRRQRRKWFSRKYYASVMRLKEFYEDNVGRSFTGILSDFARRKK